MKTQNMTMSLMLILAVLVVGNMSTGGFAQAGQAPGKSETVVVGAARASQAWSAADFANARPMPLPMAGQPALEPLDGGLSAERLGTPGFVRGFAGNGRRTPTVIPKSVYREEDRPAPEEYGTAYHPYTTMRVDVSAATPATAGGTPSNAAPFRAAGKLYFKIGTVSHVCSASLIKRGVIVTAAHCVNAFGGAAHNSWVFVPAKYDAEAPYGSWTASEVRVLASWQSGTDSCYQLGVICRNDVAVIRLAPQGGQYPGTATGWFGYGYNGHGFTPNRLTQVNQLGYPVSHDLGNRMQRTDSQGFVSISSGATVWGSRQTGGSSGGPALVNLGIAPALSGTVLGSGGAPNTVVGVTSWGYRNDSIKQNGASPFTLSNIGTLVPAVCAAAPLACM